MTNKRSRFAGVFWSLILLALLALNFSAAYFLTGKIYREFHLEPSPLLVQVINSFLGLLFSGILFCFVSLFFRRKRSRTFQAIIDAMERIARGDFSVYLEEQDKHGHTNDLAASVNKMARDLGQLETMRQEFVSNVSHEIQSPLTSIRGFAQALQNEGLSQSERSHYLEIIETESHRLSRLSDDLLKLTRLEADAAIEPKQYRLDRQIRDNVLACEPQWAEKNIEMDIELHEVEISADEDLLSQVWLNLLHNAIKFTPDGGGIRIELQKRDGRIEFRIKDNGIGITPEDRVHIFERFYKADRSRTHRKGGNGLGLSIVKKIVDLHHGEIDIQSEPGEGAVFIVSLPPVWVGVSDEAAEK